METLEIIIKIASIINTLAIIGIFIGLIYSKKQLHINVITNCYSRFQDILIKLYDESIKNDNETIICYLDLCNEQLFYCKYGYVPKIIALEWLQGMYNYLPHFINEKQINKESLTNKLTEGMNSINSYPRLINTFTFNDVSYKKIDKMNLKSFNIIYKNLKKIKE